MSTEATVQVLDNAVDAAGVSVVSSTRTTAHPRFGSMYNPATLAAAVPLWFHRAQDGRYLAVLRSRWTGATTVYHDGPQLFSAFDEDPAPSWVYVNPATGAADTVNPIPSNLTGDRVVNAAVSRGEFLFTLGTIGVTSDAHIAHHRTTYDGSLVTDGEEIIPLKLSLGLHVVDRTHLWVFGANEDGHLIQARKNWARIGTNTDTVNPWQYRGERGWFTDPDEISPLTDTAGAPIPIDGPCSMAQFRDRYYLAVTHGRSAQVYTARMIDPWKPLGAPVVLGDVDTYLGAGMQLQAQLPARREAMTPGTVTAFPYLTSVRVNISSDSAILTEWALLEV